MRSRIHVLLSVLAVALAAVSGQAAPADPAYYRRQATWQETILTALQSPFYRNLEAGFASFESDTLRGGQPPQKVSVELNGARDLYLFVTGIPDMKWAVGDWADARLTDTNGLVTALSDAKNFKVLLGRHEKDLTLRAGLYQKMRLHGRQFDKGLCVQANSVIRVPADGEYERFAAWIGVDDWAGTNGTVRFSVMGPRAAAGRQLFDLVARDFPNGPERQQMRWEREDRIFEFDWTPGDWAGLARRYADACHRVMPLQSQAAARSAEVADPMGCANVRAIYYQTRELDQALAQARAFDFEALQLALADLEATFPNQYPRQFRQRFWKLKVALATALTDFHTDRLADFEQVARLRAELDTLKQQALLANPLLDFERLLVLKRKPIGDARRNSWDGYGYGEFLGIPRQSSWNYGTMPNVDTWDNEIAALSPVRPTGQLATVFQPDDTVLVNDLELHWHADRLLFSMPDENKNWQVHELKLPPSTINHPTAIAPRQLTPSIHPDVHNYDGLYLPNGEIIFLSTAPLQGVPCNASVIVGMMYKMDSEGHFIRQLTFEQDHDYTPSVLNNGRVLYLRWDYTDTPHIWNRLLMSMNPDGTGQMEYYGANSYWPNAIFFARAIPEHDTKFVSIVTGHHEGRVGDLVIFDPALGRHEAQGVVQRIPGRHTPVEPKLEDKLTEHHWPKFLHPWPLNDKYFLVACKPDPDALWGIYLVDVFDNRVLVKEAEGFALLEPVPLVKRPLPPVIEDKVRPEQQDALVYMEDVYQGPGLKGVPRGLIKQLRIFTYHFGYQRLAGIDHRVGADGPWEPKRVLGTVPVEDDGSALFRVPAKAPLSFQPLDADGKAVALMRSWMTAMPGETVSCVGCHDRQSTAPPGLDRRLALKRPPDDIQPWHGPARGFSFAREVQPVLDKYCVGCHNGEPYHQPGSDGFHAVPNFPAARSITQNRNQGTPQPVQPSTTQVGTNATPIVLPDLRRDQGGFVVHGHGQTQTQFVRGTRSELVGQYAGVFDPSYAVLRQYVRVGGLESDLHLLPPMEFHANTSELFRMLLKGHHNVRLDAEAWERLATWIDLNAPCHGTWADTTKIPGSQCERRLELRRLYGGVVENCEAMPEQDYVPPTPVMPEPLPASAPLTVAAPGWPFDGEAARRRQNEGGPAHRTVDLGQGLKMEFVRIPTGVFLMGDSDGTPDERPVAEVAIERPFWMAKCEVSNEQFARFDPSHDSRFEHRSSWWFSEEYTGWPLNRPRQPVVRVSWQEAMAFCQWLSDRLGEHVTLPTEAQWEWACRAGTATPLFYGGVDTDFAPFGNLGDAHLSRLAEDGWRPRSPDLVVKDSRFNDGELVTTQVGRYRPNAWGLHDLHGNAAEWTRTTYQPYPYRADDDRDAANFAGRKVVRGGSWHDRPKYCRSGSRWAYPSYQKVYDVGFRVIIAPGGKGLAAAR